jgi:hypothetical protein
MKSHDERHIVLIANKMFLLKMQYMLDSPTEGLSSKENALGVV